MTDRGQLLQRYEGNPVLTASDWPSTVNAVFNPGVSSLDDQTVLLVRVEDRTGLSISARPGAPTGSRTGSSSPTSACCRTSTSEAERFGIEDARVTRSGDEHLIVYTGYSDGVHRLPRVDPRLSLV